MGRYIESNQYAKNAANALVHYMRNAGCDVSGDQAGEIRSIVDDIVIAAVQEVGKVMEKKAAEYEKFLREEEAIADREFGA